MIEKKLVLIVSLSVGLLSATAVQAFKYNRGQNMVNLSGSVCRTKSVSTEQQTFHAAGETGISGSQPRRVFCPIIRRATSYYAEPNEPAPAIGLERKVKLVNVEVRAGDASSTRDVACFIFGTRLSDQAVTYGVTRFLCSSATGCDGVSPAFSGNGYLKLTPASTFTGSMETVNFGVACDVADGSKINYLQASITPN